jgi:hypothetical protein
MIFPVRQIGYTNEGLGKEFVISNTGTDTISGLTSELLTNRLGNSDFEINVSLYPTIIASGETASLTVQPRNGLPIGTHTDTLIIMGDNYIGLSVELSFAVTEIGVQTYLLTIQAGEGGSIVLGTSGQHAQGTIVPITAAANSEYTFNGWITSNGGTFANANSASTTFTMPGNATTITATFTYTGTGNGVLYGDLDGDGAVSMADLILMLRFFAQPGVTIDELAADVNGDGVVDNSDLILFLRFFAQQGITLGRPLEEGGA